MAKINLTFDKNLGVKLIGYRKGYCKVKLVVKQNHLNHGGILHGGVLATLCDIALSGAVGTVMKKEEWCVTAQLNVEFLQPAFLGEIIFGYGQVAKRGGTLAFVDGGIRSRGNKLIARAQGIWVIKTRPVKKIKPAKSLD